MSLKYGRRVLLIKGGGIYKRRMVKGVIDKRGMVKGGIDKRAMVWVGQTKGDG